MNYVLVLLLLTATARAHPDGAWKWGESADKPNTDAPTQLAVADANGKLHSGAESSSGAVDVEEAADAILDSTRTGKVINTYEAVYGDPSVQKALQGGNDTEARTYIKEKLCNLGLAKECSKLYGKSYGFGGGHGGLGIDPNAISYVQPVAIVPAGSPIAAIPIGHGIKHKGHIKGGYGAPPALLPGNGYGAPPLGGIGGGIGPIGGIGGGIGPIGGIGGIGPIGGLGGLPAAPPQHIHHHTYDNGFKNKGVVGYNGGAQPLISNNYNPPPPPPVYNNPAPVYNPQPARPVYNNPPPPPPVYNNPPPVYNQPPARPYAAASNPSYTSINSANYGSPRDQCVCVPVAQCQSYDIIGRNVDYQIDPRTKGTNVTATEVEGDIVIVTTAEGRSLSNSNSTQRRRRQSFNRFNRQSGRQTIIGDDAITVISSDAPADSFPGLSPSPPSGGSPAASPGPVEDFPISSGDNGSGSTDSISVPAISNPGVNGVAGGGSLLESLKQFVQPTLGVSFGLPGGGFGNYPLNPLANNPLVNPYGGGGVPLGPVRVNPLVSLQVGKDDNGNKKFRPLVNFHVTPNLGGLSGLLGAGLGGLGAGLGGLNGLAAGGGGGFGGGLFKQSTDVGTDGTASNNGQQTALSEQQQQQLLNDYNYLQQLQQLQQYQQQQQQQQQSVINSNTLFKQGETSDKPFRFAASSGSNANSIRPLRAANADGYGDDFADGQGTRRVDVASESEASFKIHDHFKGFGKGFNKGFGGGGYGGGTFNYPVGIPVPTPIGIPTPVAQPYPVGIPTPVAQPYAVPTPVAVKIPVPEYVRVPVPQYYPVNIPVKQYTVHEVPVHVPVEVPVPVAKPYPVAVPYAQPVVHHYHEHHQRPAPVYYPPSPVYRPVTQYAASAPSSSYGVPPSSSYGVPQSTYGVPYKSQTASATYTQPAATGYDSITVHADYSNDYTFRDANKDSTDSDSRRAKGIRFVDARSNDETAENESQSSSSAVKFEDQQAKRKRSPQKGEAPAQQSDDSDAFENDDFADDVPDITPEFRESRQLGGSGGFPQCSYNQVCCRAPVGGPSRYSSTAPGTCGRRNPYGINGRIKTQPYVDGEAEFGEYPWQVAILKKDQYDNVYVCGGALVGPSHVLTAAHCIKGNAPGDLRVRLGEWDVNRESEFYPHVEKDVVSVIIHPEYYPGNLYNDIALVKFEGYVDFTQNPHIAPACLPQRNLEFTGTRCWVTGWGKDAFGTGGRYQNILKEVDVPVVSHYDCENKLRRTRLGQEFNLHQGFLCAGGEEGKDACKGDGGGPLVCESQGTWFLSGLVSWGIGCGQYDTPGVYTKVSEYYDWVQKNLIY